MDAPLIFGLDHIQLALPKEAEAPMRAFYCDVLEMSELTKPLALQSGGGFWARAGRIDVHFGIDPDFHPATKAHPAFVVENLHALADRLDAANFKITWDTRLPDVSRFFTNDPVGNRLEFIGQS